MLADTFVSSDPNASHDSSSSCYYQGKAISQQKRHSDDFFIKEPRYLISTGDVNPATPVSAYGNIINYVIETRYRERSLSVV